ncbi:MAG: RapZ C-terminal domain-containing protein [Gemmatimonadota bacterium]
MREDLVRLFEETFGEPPNAVVGMAGDGSNRSYRRLLRASGRPVVGVIGPDREENRAFLEYTRSFRAAGLPVPELYAADEDAGVYLIEDLGDTTLFDALEEARASATGDVGEGDTGGFPDALLDSYEAVVRMLPRFQVEGHAAVDYAVAYPHAEFGRQSIAWDLNYFKYHFLKLAHVPFSEARLETDFDTLTDFLLTAERDVFLYRDFQSRNVMVTPEGPRFIDYQGGRRGAPQYDIASLLYDAKADIPPGLRDRMLGWYLEALAARRSVDRGEFERLYRGFVLVRIMQALGAYGYRGFFERKPRFLKSVPFAARNLAHLLDRGLPVELPELEDVFGRIVDSWAGGGEGPESGVGLTVHIRSFSYRRGYPEDRSGHGGGHVFDCRAIENPGRRTEYRRLTGLDEPVARFLADLPDAREFFERAAALCRSQLDEYRRRGFDHFSVSFGCTGGQHRSVYFAERLAEELREGYPDVRVRVEHRERHTWPRRPGA